jgi:serine palmitoyltransferase
VLTGSTIEWTPEPLLGKMSAQQELDSRVPVIESAQGAHVVLDGNVKCVNLAALNPFGLLGDPDIEKAATDALRKYGCGSCGPRGFYGTIDVHLDLERDLADFMRCEQTILYSSGFATVASAIPTFAKKGDLIFCDRGVNEAVQTGVNLSRADVEYFEHNNIGELSKLLDAVAANPKRAKKRKFVIAEGLYVNYGDVLPLDQLLPLKHKHCFYLIVDESYSLGMLGAHGGGIRRALQRQAGRRGHRHHHRPPRQHRVQRRRLLLGQQQRRHAPAPQRLGLRLQRLAAAVPLGASRRRRSSASALTTRAAAR